MKMDGDLKKKCYAEEVWLESNNNGSLVQELYNIEQDGQILSPASGDVSSNGLDVASNLCFD